jgi:hypothetical protein
MSMFACDRRWDPTLIEWPENDFRIFVGDMGPEVTDEVLLTQLPCLEGLLRAVARRTGRTWQRRQERPKPDGHTESSQARGLIRVQVLCKAFQHYDGFQMGKMIKNRLNNKNKGAVCAAFPSIH